MCGVTSGSDGYTTPEDLDNNGVPDYKQVGGPITLTRSLFLRRCFQVVILIL